jgi:hypothetical protein
MAHFTASSKNYPSGSDLPAGFSNDFSLTPPGGGTPPQFGPYPITAPSSVGNQPFLFWDTGRHVTNKRTVKWTFNHYDQWTNWIATAWYGPPGGNGTSPLITAGSYWIGHGVLSPTPIQAPPASTFHNGPGGEVAWPWNGDNHVANTTWGNGTVNALDQETSGSSTLDFASWTQFIPGGDDNGFFDETDDGVTSSTGVFGVPASAPGDQNFAFTATHGATILASYVTPLPPHIPKGGGHGTVGGGVITVADPSPFRQYLEQVLETLVKVTEAEGSVTPDLFVDLVDRAQKSTHAQLTRLAAETRAILARGEAALKNIEALAAERPDR